MEECGFINGEFEIKLLILYILNRLPEPVDIETLQNMVLCDAGISYFDFSSCLQNLIKTEHILISDDLYEITEKGRINCAAAETQVPYSVRVKADKATNEAAIKLKKSSLIKANHTYSESGESIVHLSMDDGLDPVINLNILVGSEELSTNIENKFKKNAEEIYSKILMLLSE